MKKIVFATNNKHKLQEVKAILAGKADVLGLADIGCNDDIPETGNTLEENALLKARYVYEKYNTYIGIYLLCSRIGSDNV